MKKQIITLALICASFSIFAQNEDYRGVLSVNAGSNAFTLLKGVITDAAETSGSTVDMKATPSFALSYDYGVKKWFSIGGQASFNSMSFDAKDLEVTKDDGTVLTGDVVFKATRIPVLARMLFHYGNAGKFDMYSGISLGASIWTGSVDGDGTIVEEIENGAETSLRGVKSSGVLPTGQITLFGLRGYVTENIGIGFETAIGAPYFASLQLNYRLGGGKK